MCWLADAFEIRQYGKKVIKRLAHERDNSSSGDLSDFNNFDCHYTQTYRSGAATIAALPVIVEGVKDRPSALLATA
jgi:hypothetical protein